MKPLEFEKDEHMLIVSYSSNNSSGTSHTKAIKDFCRNYDNSIVPEDCLEQFVLWLNNYAERLLEKNERWRKSNISLSINDNRMTQYGVYAWINVEGDALFVVKKVNFNINRVGE